MSWVIVVLCCVFTVELLFRSSLFALLKHVKTTYTRILWVFTDKEVADSWKEEVLPKYAGSLFLDSIKLLWTLLMVFAPFIIALVSTALIGWEDFSLLLSSLPGILGATGIALLYGFARRVIIRRLLIRRRHVGKH